MARQNATKANGPTIPALPGSQANPRRLCRSHPRRIVAKVVVRVKNRSHSDPLVEPEYIWDAEPAIVVL
jgi:hypothetical protein